MARINYDGKKTEKSLEEEPRKKAFGAKRPAKLGTEKNPARVSVRTEERQKEVAALFEEKGWKYAVEVEPDQAEETADLERLLNPLEPVTVEKKVGRNEPCPCGSGKKHKKCCGR
jgi:SWIM/SEC-C metal-binding protein